LGLAVLVVAPAGIVVDLERELLRQVALTQFLVPILQLVEALGLQRLGQDHQEVRAAVGRIVMPPTKMDFLELLGKEMRVVMLQVVA
jgi:hypothetical protein